MIAPSQLPMTLSAVFFVVLFEYGFIYLLVFLFKNEERLLKISIVYFACSILYFSDCFFEFLNFFRNITELEIYICIIILYLHYMAFREFKKILKIDRN